MAWEEALSGISEGVGHAIRNVAGVSAIKGEQQRQAVNAMQIEELQKKKAYAEAYSPLPDAIQNDPEYLDMTKRVLGQAGHQLKEVDGKFYATNEALQYGVETFKKSQEIQTQVLGLQLKRLSPQRDKAEFDLKALQKKEKEKPGTVDPAKMSEAQRAFDDVDGKIKETLQGMDSVEEVARTQKIHQFLSENKDYIESNPDLMAQMNAAKSSKELLGIIQNVRKTGKLIKRKPGEEVIDEQGNVVIEAKPGEETKDPKTDFGTFKAGRPKKEGESDADWNKRVSDEWEARQDKRAVSKQKIIIDYRESKGALTPDAIEVEAAKYAMTGQMPPMGMNNPVMRAKIINGAAAYLKKQGIDPASVPGIQAEFKGSKDTYVAMKKSTEQFGVFEKGMIKNADYALQLSSKYYRTQLPPVNQVVNAIRTKTGDPQVVEFGTAIYAASMEFEKIRTAGTGITSAELSVGAQKKAEEIMSTAQTHQQLTAVIKAMKTDAKNIMSSRRETLKVLGGEMKGIQSNISETSAPVWKMVNGVWKME